MALTFYNAYKERYSYINIRSSYSVTSKKVGTLPDGNYYLYYDDIHVSAQSSTDYFIHLPAYGGWVACSNQGSKYINYGLSVYQGEAFAKYYWPNAGTTSYALQATDKRKTAKFTLRSSPGNLTIDGTKSNITLTINYNNGTANGSQAGKKWTRTSYAFNGWDRKTSASPPGSVTAGTKDHSGGVTFSSTEDLHFYADYTTGTSSTKYLNNTKSLGTPTKNKSSVTYTVTYNANGGTVSTTSATAKKTTTYTFSKWTGSNTNISVSGTSCTFIGSGTVTANYTSSTSTTSITLPTPTRAGYKFLGWSTNSAATTGTYQGGASYTPTTSITLYAIWGLNGLVRVYNGTEWKLAIPYVFNGSYWQQTIPFIYDGSTWRQGG